MNLSIINAMHSLMKWYTMCPHACNDHETHDSLKVLVQSANLLLMQISVAFSHANTMLILGDSSSKINILFFYIRTLAINFPFTL
jgi:hypothetical protein